MAFGSGNRMAQLQAFLSGLLHIDQHLHQLSVDYGGLSYLILFAIVFCETGLVVTPWLPGDSLLFATGALAARGFLHIEWLLGIFIAAAILGDTVNYWFGSLSRRAVFDTSRRVFFDRRHLDRTSRFYEKHGSRTIIIARFVPIVRTFAPFVAGVGAMNYRRFVTCNVAGGILWVGVCLGGGYLWGNLPFVQRNFGLVIAGMIVASLIPVVAQWLAARREKDEVPETPALQPEPAGMEGQD
jgi:membrane-associated protein